MFCYYLAIASKGFPRQVLKNGANNKELHAFRDLPVKLLGRLRKSNTHQHHHFLGRAAKVTPFLPLSPPQ